MYALLAGIFTFSRSIIIPVYGIIGGFVFSLIPNYIGSIEIPDVLSLPEPLVQVSTRKGVVVSYPIDYY